MSGPSLYVTLWVGSILWFSQWCLVKVNGPSYFPTSLVSAREMWASVALNTEHYRQTKAVSTACCLKHLCGICRCIVIRL